MGKITTKKQYRESLAMLSNLMSEDPEPQSPEGVVLLALSEEIQSYEKRFKTKSELLVDPTDNPHAVKLDTNSLHNQLKIESYRRKHEPWYNFQRTMYEGFWRTYNWFRDTPYNLRRLRWSFTRARKGWAPNDTWSFDHYLNNVMRDGLRHLAEHTHGHPGFYESHEKWQEFLRSVAQSIEDYEREEEDHEYDDIKVKMDKEAKAYEAMQKKLHELVDVWGHLWD